MNSTHSFEPNIVGKEKKAVTQSKSKTQITRSVHGKFNFITVKYNWTRHSIYIIRC